MRRVRSMSLCPSIAATRDGHASRIETSAVDLYAIAGGSMKKRFKNCIDQG